MWNACTTLNMLDVFKNLGTKVAAATVTQHAAEVSIFFRSLLHSYHYKNINWNDVKIHVKFIVPGLPKKIHHFVVAAVTILCYHNTDSTLSNMCIWMWLHAAAMMRCLGKQAMCVCFFASDSFRRIFIFHTHSCRRVICLAAPLALLSWHCQHYYLLLKSLSFGHESWLFSEVDSYSNE